MSKTRARKVQELIGLAMKVQFETSYCVFVRFSGHIDQIEIDIRESKENYHTEIISGSFYTNEDGKYYDGEYFDRRYNNMRKALVEILETGEFNPESENVDLERTEIVSYEYKF